MSRHFKIYYKFSEMAQRHLVGTFRTREAFLEMDRLSKKLYKSKFIRINPMKLQREQEVYFMEILND